jgi:oligopeptide/dipeptide ABC transporter ATP-binding protein
VFARLAQTLTATIADSDFLAASRLLGVPRRKLLTRHVLPNIAEPLVLNVSLAVGGALLAISALSFLGLGVQPPGYDWGRLMQEGLPRIYTTPSNALAPALAIVLTGVGFSLAGEAVAGYVGRRSGAPSTRRAAPATVEPGAAPPPRGPATGDQDAVLRVRDLRVSFDTPAGPVSPVRGVDLTIRPGEIVGIVGESGSGKSLTALALADLLPHPGRLEAGELSFLGRPLTELSARERAALLGTSLAMIYQNPMSSMNPLLRVGRQLSEVAEVHGGLSRPDARARAVDRLRKVRIPNATRRMGQYPHEFSGGMRQRAMIAMGLMVSPGLIIADEPTTALDVTVQQQVLTLLRDVSSSTGAAVLFISHDLAVVSQLCSRVLVMYAGRIVEELDIETLHSAPAHPYTRALMASLPSMELPRDRVLETIPGRPPDPASLPTGCPFAPRCAHASDRSHQVEPALEPLDRPGHRVACHTPQRSDLALTSAAGSR